MTVCADLAGVRGGWWGVWRCLFEEHLWRHFHREPAADLKEQDSPSPGEFDVVSDEETHGGKCWDGGGSNVELG